MAAHVITALKELRGWYAEPRTPNREIPWDQLDAALVLATWTEDLDIDDYRAFLTVVQNRDSIGLWNWTDLVLGKYSIEWETLKQPRTREEWRVRKWA
jgi:hypothetical protein